MQMNGNLVFSPFFFGNKQVILHFFHLFQKYELFLLLFFLNLCMHLKCEKSVAYIQDVFLIKKSRFLVCLKTRRATKRDVLVLATLRYLKQNN